MLASLKKSLFSNFVLAARKLERKPIDFSISSDFLEEFLLNSSTQFALKRFCFHTLITFCNVNLRNDLKVPVCVFVADKIRNLAVPLIPRQYQKNKRPNLDTKRLKPDLMTTSK